ncbi:MAG: hypothetical protein IPJ75_17490 [Ignavibacteriales bacterium]|nr:hypothetical protein [Ignavibacteriales bacterium]
MNILIIGGVTFVALIIISFLIFNYYFSIYEVTFGKVPEKVKIGDSVTISLTPVNGAGTKVPFRTSPFEIKFIEGESTVKVINDKSAEGEFIFKTTSPGNIKLLVTPKHALKPTLFEIVVGIK